jgi:hypothetical protein
MRASSLNFAGKAAYSPRQDEESVIEAAIPLRSIGLAPEPGTRLLDISHCDIPKRSKEKRCGAWGTPKGPKLLELTP